VDLPVLPLAVTMMAGPQIVAATVLATSPAAVRVSLAFLGGVAVAVAAGLTVTTALATALGDTVALGSASDAGSAGNLVKYALVALLVATALRNWRNRRTAQPPRWLASLMTAGASRAFTVGLLAVALMPSDLLVLLTVGVHLAQTGDALPAALPFAALTLLIAALPLLLLLLLGHRARAAMPRARDWMNSHSWLITIAVCLLFVALILF
jgi:hypothetical protein